MNHPAIHFLLRHGTLVLFGVIVAIFGALSPKFLSGQNAFNICVQAAPVGLVATGMTFVLLTAGVDLSVGAAMFVGGAVAAKMVLAGYSFAVSIAAMALVGIAFGAVNAFFITRLKLAPFIVTLATLFIGRGFALWLTETRAMNLPESFLRLGAVRWLGIPLPLVILGVVAGALQFVLKRTPFGRQLYAVGNNAGNARKAGLRVGMLVGTAYLISGLCAALGGILALAQLGAVSPKFGENYEFKAIAAAVLGGTSLFGGRGAVWPGTLMGALLIQMIESGLVMLNADPYLYPLVTAAVIFIAVLLDSLRQQWVLRTRRRLIFREGDLKPGGSAE